MKTRKNAYETETKDVNVFNFSDRIVWKLNTDQDIKEMTILWQFFMGTSHEIECISKINDGISVLNYKIVWKSPGCT